MRDKKVILSKRLQMLADMVTPGNRVVDVGCDHGFLSIYLVEQGISPSALGMDVRTGPLAAAIEHISERSLQDKIATRLSDGLQAYEIGEADTCVCAGMGGKLMAKILSDSMDKANAMRELILQPQSELAEFRSFLRENAFEIMQEDAVLEDGKYYFAMKVQKNDSYGQKAENERKQLIWDTFGKGLLEGRHPVLLSFLEFRIGILQKILQNIDAESSEKSENRMREIRDELDMCLQAKTTYFS